MDTDFEKSDPNVQIHPAIQRSVHPVVTHRWSVKSSMLVVALLSAAAVLTYITLDMYDVISMDLTIQSVDAAPNPQDRTYVPRGVSAIQKRAFGPSLNISQKASLLKLMHHFHQTLSKANQSLTYFMSFGTLLGSYRHHNLIPWSDCGLSVMVPDTERHTLTQLITDGPVFNIKSQTGTQLKIAIDSFQDSASSTWFPSLYVYFYSTHSDHIIILEDDSKPQDHSLVNQHSLRRYPQIPRDIIFPLLKRTLGEASYPAPRDPRAFLGYLGYDVDMCVSHRSPGTSRVRRSPSVISRARSPVAGSHYKVQHQYTDTGHTHLQQVQNHTHSERVQNHTSYNHSATVGQHVYEKTNMPTSSENYVTDTKNTNQSTDQQKQYSNTEKVEKDYNIEISEEPVKNVEQNDVSTETSVHCSELVNISVPFVVHFRGPWGVWCMEELHMGTEVITTVLRTAKNINTC